MAQLRQGYPEFVARGAEVIVIGPEDANAFKRYWLTEELPFIGVPDPIHSVLARFGQEVNIFKLGRMPAQVVIDRQGVARFAHYGDSMRDIPSNAELLSLLDQLNAPMNDEVKTGT
jgi:peroxiredoxin